LLVNIGTQRVLIDAGNGVETGGDGRLLAHLEVLGIGRNEIDIVVLTHAHLDHYAGMLHQSGAKIFPNARYLMWHDEWEYYSSTEQLERERARSEERLAFIEQWFLPLGPYLELIDADLAEIAPGIRANYLPGHTRHHIGFIVESEGEQLLVSGDTFLHPLFLKQPHWHLPFDLDPVVLKQTREQLIALSAENDMLVHSYHTAFPGLGRISIEDSLVRWEAV
jgi:glyoxylase-like metal-dependent hydrolase (beta-lactamase superfamily II)